MKLVSKIIFRISFVLMIIVGGFSLGQPLFYGHYYDSMEKDFLVDGLKDGVIPQGITYVAEHETWLYRVHERSFSKLSIYFKRWSFACTV